MHHKITGSPCPQLELMALQLMEDCGMWNKPGGTIIVGFSGGADSVCLLHLLAKFAQTYQNRMIACHINHNLRGDESQRDQNFAEKFCDKYNIELIIRSVNIQEERQQGESIELAARRIRYDIFREIAESYSLGESPARIATAHTISDQAETILFRIARGTSLKGLQGIPMVRGNIIRPLLRNTREQVEAYCQFYELDYVTDSSNLTDDYARNQLRHHVVPVLEGINSGFHENIGKLVESAIRDSTFLEKLTTEAMEDLSRPNGLDRDGLLELDAALQDRIIAQMLESIGSEVSTKKVKDVMEVLRAGTGAIEVCGGKWICATEQRLSVKEKLSPVPEFCIPFLPGRIPVLEGKNVNILLCDYEKYKNIEKISRDILKNSLDYGKIKDNAVIRSRQNGDKIRLAGHAITRPLKKMFNEAKIPVEKRGEILVVSDADGPVWVEGFGTRYNAVPSVYSNRIAVILSDAEWKRIQPLLGRERLQL